MPFFNASKREQCMTETYDTISMIELLIEEHPQHSIVIGGDLNTDLKNESAFDPLWNQLAVARKKHWLLGTLIPISWFNILEINTTYDPKVFCLKMTTLASAASSSFEAFSREEL